MVKHVDAQGRAGAEAVVVIEGGAAEADVVGGETDLREGALRAGGFRRGVQDAAGAAEAEENGVGAAGFLEALGVVGIGNDRTAEIIARARCLLTADAELKAAGVHRDALRGGRLVGALGHGGGGVAHEIRLVEGVEVGHELGREDRDRVGHVGEVRAQARTGEGVVGEVADVLSRRDRERREQDGVAVGCGRSGGSRGVGLESGDGECEEGNEAHGEQGWGWGQKW